MGSQLYQPRANGASLRVWLPIGAFGNESLLLLGVNSPKETGDLFSEAYEELIHFITNNMGYQLGVDFFIFTYDWTQSNKASGRMLRQFIFDKLRDQPPGTQADVINHSMGGLVTRAALTRFADEPAAILPPIRRVVYLASPHFGSPQAYFVLHDAISLQFKFGGFFKKLVAEATWDALIKKRGDPDSLETALKMLARDLPSVYELLPDDFYFAARTVLERETRTSIGSIVLSFVLGRSPVRGRTTYHANLRVPPALRPDPPLPQNAWDMADFQEPLVQDALDFKRQLGRQLPGAAENNLVIYSSDQQTADFVVFVDNPLGFADGFNDPGESVERGDGTVPTFSGRAGLPPGLRVVDVGGTHNEVANKEPSFRLIHRFLDRPD